MINAKDYIKGKVSKNKDYPDPIMDEENTHICDVRGWGELSTKYGSAKAFKIQCAIGQFIVDAINEKLEREQTEQNEKLPCEHNYQPDTTCGVNITCCKKCGDII